MPRGTKVHKVYEALRREGMSQGKAARIAQSKTGLSLATGKKPKGERSVHLKHMREHGFRSD